MNGVLDVAYTVLQKSKALFCFSNLFRNTGCPNSKLQVTKSDLCVFRQQSFADMSMLVVIVMMVVCAVVLADLWGCSCFIPLRSYVAS